MGQSKKGSLLEASLNTASGFILSLIVWRFFVAPMFGFSLDMGTNVAVTSIFTVVSIARSYCWRRIFNSQEQES